jgi:phospholipase A1
MQTVLRVLAALALGLGFATGAAGQSALVDCHGIESDSERLACYDRLSGRRARDATTTVPAPSVMPQPPTGGGTATMPASPASFVASPAPVKPPSLLEQSWNLEPDSSRYGVSWYRSNYLLFARWTNNVNEKPFSPVFGALDPEGSLQSTEAKFQISGKLRFLTTDDRRWSLYAAYTQQNHWQVYNADVSRPFRETNYMPELFVSYAPGWDLLGLNLRVINFGYTHQSNGRADPLSRSWDRLFLEGGFDRGNFAMYARAWYRIPQDEAKDDNPDITDYYGHGELSGLYRWRGNSFTGMLRGNLSTGKGAVQLGWYSRPFLGPIRAYAQFFSGYGESMIDYNWNQTTIGAGIALSDGL